jgi:hypothetical protein
VVSDWLELVKRYGRVGRVLAVGLLLLLLLLLLVRVVATRVVLGEKTLDGLCFL